MPGEPSGATNPFGQAQAQNQPQAPTNPNPFAPKSEPIPPSADGFSFPTPTGERNSNPDSTPAAAAAVPLQSPPNPGTQPSTAPNAFDPTSVPQSPETAPNITPAPEASGTPHPNFGEVPENSQSNTDLESLLKAATRSETETLTQQRKPRSAGMALRVALITLGLGVAGIALLLIDYKLDGIAMLHKVPGFSAVSGKFQSFLPSGDDDSAVPSPSEVASASAAPKVGNDSSTTAAAQVPPESDTSLAATDETDNGEDTIPLAGASPADKAPGTVTTAEPGADTVATPPAPPASTPSRTEIATSTPSRSAPTQPGPNVGNNANNHNPAGSTAIPEGASQAASALPGINDTTSPGPADAGLFPTGDGAATTLGASATSLLPPDSIQLDVPDDTIVLDPPNKVGNSPTAAETTMKSTPGTDPAANLGTPSSTDGAMASATSPTAAKPDAVGPLRELAPGPLAEQRGALVSFLKGANWQERLPYIYRADSLKSSIETYYQSHPDGALPEHELEFFHLDESTENGGPYWIFFVTTPAAPDGFPAIVRRTPEGFKVDWECFVEFNDRLFVHFFESGEAGPKQFRVVLKRTDYWGPDRPQFTTLNYFICYRVELPYTDLDHYAFVASDDPLAEELSKKVTWGMPPLASIVSFERVNFAHGQSHLKIVDLVTDGWHSP